MSVARAEQLRDLLHKWASEARVAGFIGYAARFEEEADIAEEARVRGVEEQERTR